MTTGSARLQRRAWQADAPRPTHEAAPDEVVATGTFAALHNADYRLFFSGSMVSNIGMWMQVVAQGWLVVTLTSSSFLVGLVSFCAMIPNLLFSLFGGLVADRADKRQVLILGQIASTVLTGALAVLIQLHMVQLWHIMAISFAVGTVAALTGPSWQAIVPELVGRKTLLNAIALNSAQFNLTRVVGPSVGGILLRYIGIAGAYYANALSFLGLLLAMVLIRPKHSQAQKKRHSEGVTRDLLQSFSYVRHHRLVRTVMLLAAVQTLFIFPYSTLLPVFAKQVLGLGAGGYSVLLISAGVGAFIGAMLLAFLGEMIHRSRYMLIAQVVFALGVAVFACSRSLPLSVAALFFVGWALVSFMATGNTLVQSLVPDELRGRVMALWMLAGFGLAPIGSLQVGAVASLTSPTLALVAGSVVTLAFTVGLTLRNQEVFHRLAMQQPEPATA
ncbi:MAG: MFS transporter [Chloroflexota bacterium]|nr:MFS transporter [Chloroflexota bacterium]